MSIPQCTQTASIDLHRSSTVVVQLRLIHHIFSYVHMHDDHVLHVRPSKCRRIAPHCVNWCNLYENLRSNLFLPSNSITCCCPHRCPPSPQIRSFSTTLCTMFSWPVPAAAGSYLLPSLPLSLSHTIRQLFVNFVLVFPPFSRPQIPLPPLDHCSGCTSPHPPWVSV